MAVLRSDDLELLWTRIEVEVDLPLDARAAPVSLCGTVKLWVLPKERTGVGAPGAVRLHCRQCTILGASVNGVAVKWELLDPHAIIVHDPGLEGDGEAFEVMHRAALMAAHDGELKVDVPARTPPCSLPDLAGEDLGASAVEGFLGRQAAAQALSELRVRQPSPLLVLVEIRFALDNPQNGFKTMLRPRSVHRA